MWVILAVSVQMLSGPNVWPVLDEGTFVSEVECQAVLDEAVPRTLPIRCGLPGNRVS